MAQDSEREFFKPVIRKPVTSERRFMTCIIITIIVNKCCTYVDSSSQFYHLKCHQEKDSSTINKLVKDDEHLSKRYMTTIRLDAYLLLQRTAICHYPPSRPTPYCNTKEHIKKYIFKGHTLTEPNYGYSENNNI